MTAKEPELIILESPDNSESNEYEVDFYECHSFPENSSLSAKNQSILI
jgi:hypothetical protein